MIQQIFYKNETFLALFIVVCILIFSFTLKNQVILSVFIISVIGVVGLVSLSNYRIGVLVLSSSFSLNGFVRLYDLENLITAGFGFFLSLILVSVLFLHLLIRNNLRLKYVNNLLLVYVFLSIYIIILYAIGSYISPLILISYFREYILPFFLFFVFLFVLKTDINFLNKILFFVVWPAAIVALFNIYHYVFGMNIVFSQYVLAQGGSSLPDIRNFFGISLPRSNHILGLGTQGGGGVFYMLLSVLGFMLLKNQKRLVKIVLVLSSFTLATASIMTLSASIILVILIFMAWYIIFYFKIHPTYGKLIVLLMVLPVLFAVLFYPMGINNIHDAIIDYAVFGFLSNFINDLGYFTILNHLFGEGLAIAGQAGEIANTTQGLFDRWIFSLYVQFGLFGFIFFLFFWLYPIIKFFFIRCIFDEVIEKAVFSCGFIILGVFAYAHGAAIMHRLFMPIMMLSFAAFYVVFTGGKTNMLSKGKN